jgi:hypothetical protein
MNTIYFEPLVTRLSIDLTFHETDSLLSRASRPSPGAPLARTKASCVQPLPDSQESACSPVIPPTAPSANSYDRPSNSPTTNYRFSPWLPPIPSKALHRCPLHPCLTATEVLKRRHHKGAHLSSSAELPHKRPSTSPTTCGRPSPHDR